MPLLADSNFVIAAAGDFDFSLSSPGLRSAIGLGGDFDGGTLTVSWVDNAGNVVAFPDAEFTESGGIEIAPPTSQLRFTYVGVGDPDIKVTVRRLR